ncbi:MAG: RagB/SusD family nutrient uptake outer membrane protein, partial [Alistipes sp.]|nr:RagB/SusD family nutrient uptake outer membrane protein [Alistipes sp.]
PASAAIAVNRTNGYRDIVVLHLSDIYLVAAEAALLADDPATALTYINDVRSRAGVAEYTSAELSSRYQFREAVRAERRLELAFENQRWFDLLRWGVATTTVNEYINSEAFYSEYNYTVNPIADWQTMLPIPLSVININPDVAQNVGY